MSNGVLFSSCFREVGDILKRRFTNSLELYDICVPSTTQCYLQYPGRDLI